ncbi:hypothetical protein SEVIR_7G175901v4 [Setaria viridis]
MRPLFPRRRAATRAGGHRTVRVRPAPAAARSCGASRDLPVTRLVRTHPSRRGVGPRAPAPEAVPPSRHVCVPRGVPGDGSRHLAGRPAQRCGAD